MFGALGRFGFASLGLWLVMLWYRPWPRLTLNLWWRLMAMGLFGVFFYNLCFFQGLRTVPAGRASLLSSMQPMFVFVFSALVWGEAITWWKIGGLAVSLFGASLVLSQGHWSSLFTHGLNTGDLWILGCAISWVIYTLLGRTVAGKISAVSATAYSTWLGTAALLLAARFEPWPQQSWSPTVWIAFAFLGLGGTTIAFLLYLQGIAQIGASRASIFINLVPVFGVIFSSLFLGEMVSMTTLLGGAIVIAGVRALNR